MRKELLDKFKNMKDIEKIEIISETTKGLKRSYKGFSKASDSYFNYDGVNTGVRGGKNSSLYANMEKHGKTYRDLSKQLKELVKLL